MYGAGGAECGELGDAEPRVEGTGFCLYYLGLLAGRQIGCVLPMLCRSFASDERRLMPFNDADSAKFARCTVARLVASGRVGSHATH